VTEDSNQHECPSHRKGYSKSHMVQRLSSRRLINHNMPVQRCQYLCLLNYWQLLQQAPRLFWLMSKIGQIFLSVDIKRWHLAVSSCSTRLNVSISTLYQQNLFVFAVWYSPQPAIMFLRQLHRPVAVLVTHFIFCEATKNIYIQSRTI